MNDNYSPPPPALAAGARVWAYLRDSGGPNQTESVAQQEGEIKSYCQRYALRLGRVFRDVAKSGGNTVKRDEFRAMVDLSEDEYIRPDAILIWNFARFSRDYDDFQFYKSTLKRRGVIVHSLTDSIPADDYAARVMETIISLANEEKRRQTSRDVKRGLKDLTEKRFAPGVPPRGYKAVPVCIGENRNGIPHYVSRWEPDPALREYVILAWQLRAEGKSYAEITKATDGRLYTSSGSWVSFFQNKSYLGVYGKREIQDHHEALITWPVWEAVQRLHESHPLYGGKGLNNPRRMGNPSLLTGLLFCECGAAMTHSKGYNSPPWRHYICGKKQRQGNRSCNSRRVGADKADAEISAVLLNRILTPDYFAEALEMARRNMQSSADVERKITAESRRLEDLSLSIQRLLRTIEKTDSPAALELLQRREAEYTQARAELERLRRQLATVQLEITPAAGKVILAAWRERFQRSQEVNDIRESRAFLSLFIQRIEVGYNDVKKMTTAKIFYTYPMSDPEKCTSYRESLGAQEKSP